MDEWQVVVETQDRIGEGPAWDAATGTLLWVDIAGRMVRRLDPASGRMWQRELDQMVGAVLLRASGGLAYCLRDGVWVSDSDDGPARRLAPIEADDATTRMNDAKTDRRGRLWAGTMAIDARPDAGALYRVDADGSVTLVDRPVTISNGIDWSTDDRLMYYIDSATHRLDVFDFDLASGTAVGRRTHIDLRAVPGLPDGMTVDAEGCLWVAFYDGWSVRRFTPDGRLDRVVELPTARITSCAFGGPDLADLYVTSATDGLDAGQLHDQPLAGALFVVRPGVGGLPVTPFAG
jgi:sugar lactone lactonase YvrE